MHFDREAHLKLLKLHKNIGQAVACLYLYLGLTGGISLLFRNAKKCMHRVMISDSQNLISFEKNISATIKYAIVSWSN